MLPERDLSANEIDAFGGLALLMGTGLYEAVAEQASGPAPEVSEQPATESSAPAPADISLAPAGKRKRK